MPLYGVGKGKQSRLFFSKGGSHCAADRRETYQDDTCVAVHGNVCGNARMSHVFPFIAVLAGHLVNFDTNLG